MKGHAFAKFHRWLLQPLQLHQHHPAFLGTYCPSLPAASCITSSSCFVECFSISTRLFALWVTGGDKFISTFRRLMNNLQMFVCKMYGKEIADIDLCREFASKFCYPRQVIELKQPQRRFIES